jgi:outer membrane protein OmpA-like peptidoglycan-associated protein
MLFKEVYMKKILSCCLIMMMSFVYAEVQAEEVLQIQGPERATKMYYEDLDESRLLVSILDEKDNPIRELQTKDITITRGSKNAKVISVLPLERSQEIPLNVVLVLDNSFSMKQRKAVDPMLAALEEAYEIIRPIDNVHGIVFDNDNKIQIKDRGLHIKTINSNDVPELRTFFKESFTSNLSSRTYLYDAMYAGLDILTQMPDKGNKFMVVFTDGEDINSIMKKPELQAAAMNIDNFTVYAIDYTEKPTLDEFLKQFAENHNGRIWKAGTAGELVTIFDSFANSLLHRYVVTYRFFAAPQGTLAIRPSTITIEEVTTIDRSPMLNYVFFETGESTISDPYILFSNESERQNFSASMLKDPIQKHSHVLNIIGKRLSQTPDAKISIVGNNSNTGKEKGNMALSQNRAEAVQSYLQAIWGIDSSRMEISARNLPAAPSSTATPAGIAENQRVEIHSDHAAILEPIQSMYVQKTTDTSNLRVEPQIQAEAGVDMWVVELKGEDDTVIESTSGSGDMSSAFTFNLVKAGLSRIASFDSMTASVEVTDKSGETFKDETAATTRVNYIKREQMKAQKRGNQVLEKYALILFDFDSAEIKQRNKEVVDQIIARMNEMPDARLSIVGHTDNIGAESYNDNLSKRRAQAVLDQLMAAGMTSDQKLSHTGVGARNPLYNNATPEGRALNRTVTVTLEYREQM